MKSTKKANGLINEKSPYLLQHAYNPVNWYPWSKEAFNKAKLEDKPIFLSIGYSTCHWCHIMEKESFEDEEIAKILNNNYISIKVDREERPDIDSLYMNVCQRLTGSGGWPLTIIMTPEKKPFFAGTYFPKYSRWGMIGLKELLEKIITMWDNDKEHIIETSEKIFTVISSDLLNFKTEKLNLNIFKDVYEQFLHLYDDRYGGFGSAPKFPTPHNLMFLLRYSIKFKEKKALEMVTNTLENMYKGGLFDHIGFGFARYSTDHKWLVPHFEKMLYDNALLAIAYTEAYQLTGRNIFADIAKKIFKFVLVEMTSPLGGFYSSIDADSEGQEGKYYLWDKQEIIDILGAEDGNYFCRYFNITEEGNFEEKNIPNLIGQDLNKLDFNFINKCQVKLLENRNKRVPPFKDDKILTSWNGLMIVALAIGGRVFKEKIYVNASKTALNFILNYLCINDRLYARYRDGETKYYAYLDDYSFLTWGLIELYETTYDPCYLEIALKMQNKALDIFWDIEQDAFFLTGMDSEEVLVRTKEIYDGALPSGNSVAALNLLRLGRILGNSHFEEMAVKILESFGGEVKKNPTAYTYYLIALLFYLTKTKELIICLDKYEDKNKDFIEMLNKSFQPFLVSLVFNPQEENNKLKELIPYLENLSLLENKTTIYLCENFTCKVPFHDIKEFKKILKEI